MLLDVPIEWLFYMEDIMTYEEILPFKIYIPLIIKQEEANDKKRCNII
jgi:hypothetical protein